MWILFAFGSALFAGLTSILAKCGIRKTDSDTATAIRTIVVLLFSWLMVAIVGSAPTITGLSAKTWVFLILSGLATGASWLCYFRALQLGDVNKVVPIDKSSTILTIVLAFLFLGEGTTWLKGAAVVLIAIGTFLMIEKKAVTGNKAERKSWLVYAILSAVFASLTSILGKVGIEGVESNLGTAIRTGVVLVMAWLIVFVKGKQHTLKEVPKKDWNGTMKPPLTGNSSCRKTISSMATNMTISGKWVIQVPAARVLKSISTHVRKKKKLKSPATNW